jgi:prepilin-type N-terminal cleavage/methylation domain-containing protein
MKKSFTLIELIIVIVVMGILSNITFDILSKLYKNYIYTKEMNKLNEQLDFTMEVIAAKMKDRVRNSVIVTKYPAKWSDSDEDKVDFKSIGEVIDGDEDYNIIEWINKDYEAKNGMWDSSVNHIQTGWSAFVDLGYNSHKVADNPKEFNITTADSNFTIVKLIDRNITSAFGFNEDPFESNTTTLIFAGNDLGGDLLGDINHSYGWYLNSSKGREAKVVFSILDYNVDKNSSGLYSILNISSITENNDSTLYSRYFLTRSAYAIVPIFNQEQRDDGENVNDYNLSLIYNYQPWQGDWWNGTHGDANSTLLARHVTEIRFKKDVDTPVIRLYICIQSPNIMIDEKNTSDKNDNRYLTLCKEKAIF